MESEWIVFAHRSPWPGPRSFPLIAGTASRFVCEGSHTVVAGWRERRRVTLLSPAFSVFGCQSSAEVYWSSHSSVWLTVCVPTKTCLSEAPGNKVPARLWRCPVSLPVVRKIHYGPEKQVAICFRLYKTCRVLYGLSRWTRFSGCDKMVGFWMNSSGRFLVACREFAVRLKRLQKWTSSGLVEPIGEENSIRFGHKWLYDWNDYSSTKVSLDWAWGTRRGEK